MAKVDAGPAAQSLKVVHRGHEICLSREACLGGWEMTYYGIYRLSDGFECTAGYTEDEADLPVIADQFKERIDAELAEADPWDEREQFGDLA